MSTPSEPQERAADDFVPTDELIAGREAGRSGHWRTCRERIRSTRTRSMRSSWLTCTPLAAPAREPSSASLQSRGEQFDRRSATCRGNSARNTRRTVPGFADGFEKRALRLSWR
jgi:hypothetical protein